MLRQCARWPECEREFTVSPFAPGQLYCCPQCKYHVALAIQRKKRETRPKKQIRCSVCRAPFDQLRSNETYCSDACRDEIHRQQARTRYKVRDKESYMFPVSLAKLVKDPTDSWVVGHIHRLGQVCHDLKVDPAIWGEGVTFRTMDGKETLVVKNRGLVDEQGKVRFSAYKSDE